MQSIRSLKFSQLYPILSIYIFSPATLFNKPQIPSLSTLRIIDEQWELFNGWEMLSYIEKSHPNALSLIDHLSIGYYESALKSHADVMITDQLKSKLKTDQIPTKKNTIIKQFTLTHGYPLLIDPIDFDSEKAYRPVKLVISDNPNKSGFEDNQVYLDVKHWVLLPANTKFCKKEFSQAKFVEIDLNKRSIRLDEIILNKEVQLDNSSSAIQRYSDRFTLIGLFERSAILLETTNYGMSDGPNFHNTLCVMNGKLNLGADFHFKHFLSTKEQDKFLSFYNF